MPIRPLLYGYLRADLIRDANQLEQLDRQIREFATAKGFEVGTVFREPSDLMWSAFAALMIELKRSECHHVAVPEMAHMLQPGSNAPNALVELLRAEANAFVWVADPEAGSDTTSTPDPPKLRNGG